MKQGPYHRFTKWYLTLAYLLGVGLIVWLYAGCSGEFIPAPAGVIYYHSGPQECWWYTENGDTKFLACHYKYQNITCFSDGCLTSL